MAARGEPTVDIDLSAPGPVYRQIADQLRAHLLAGRFRPGEVLPTVRQLALDLGVNHNTVAEAYRALADEGWIELGRRRGATVLERGEARADPDAAARYGRRLEDLWAEAVAHGVPRKDLRRVLLTLARRT